MRPCIISIRRLQMARPRPVPPLWRVVAESAWVKRPKMRLRKFSGMPGPRSFTATRTRRDHEKYLTLIASIALLHQYQRPLLTQTRDGQTVRQVIVASTKPGRRTGAIMLTDADGRLTGLFTDSDLARLFERRDEAALDRPIAEVMVASPTTVPSGTRVGEAVNLLATRKFSELPVVDRTGRPVGLVDVTDVLGLEAEATQKAAPAKSTKAAKPAKTSVRIFPTEGAA